MQDFKNGASGLLPGQQNPVWPLPEAPFNPKGVAKEIDLTDPLQKQVSGNHYKDLPIQPVEYIHANNIGYFEGNVIKYVSRWRKKNGIADLEKAKHYIELLIKLERTGMEKE